MTSTPGSDVIPVLEVGGTHVSAALVDPDGWTVSDVVRLPLDGQASADELIGRFVEAARSVPAVDGAGWGVAMPDPFDYATGVARFHDVGKFDALDGVDVGAALRSELGADVAFLNDADAFTLGEWTAGVAQDFARVAGITLGTGIGSGWLVDGAVVDPGYPPGGRIHRVKVFNGPLEEWVSRRAIREIWVDLGGKRKDDVREICDKARSGDKPAIGTLKLCFDKLGNALAGCLIDFRPDLFVFGGSMVASWDMIEEHVVAGLHGHSDIRILLPPILVSDDAERSGFVGAAVHASRRTNP